MRSIFIDLIDLDDDDRSAEAELKNEDLGPNVGKGTCKPEWGLKLMSARLSYSASIKFSQRSSIPNAHSATPRTVSIVLSTVQTTGISCKLTNVTQ